MSVRTYRFIIAVSIFILLASYGQAQNFYSYKPLSPRGLVPGEFLTSSTEKYKKKMRSGDISGKRHERKAKSQFYLESSFHIDELLLSGNVLFNDPVSDYVNKVADEVLKDNRRIKGKLKFYVVRSAVPNAFATDRGAIFINLGLLARLESEAQLAYIICHEISHYQKKHILKNYVEGRAIELEKGKYKKLSSYEKLLTKSHYSKDHEIEADEGGLELFMETDYFTGEIPAVFDMLKHAEEPYMPIFDQEKLFYNEYMSAEDFLTMVGGARVGEAGSESEPAKGEPPVYITDDNQPVSTGSRIDPEEFGTHPSPTMRKRIVDTLLMETGHSGSKLFAVSEFEFWNTVKIGQFESSLHYLRKFAYFDALYQSLLLQLEYPDSRYLHGVMARSLYGIAKYKMNNLSLIKFLDYGGTGWEQAKMYDYFADMSPQVAALTAISYVWSQHKELPKDKYLVEATKSLVYDMLEYFPDFNEPTKMKSSIHGRILSQLVKEDEFREIYETQIDKRRKDKELEEFLETKKGKKYTKKTEKKVRNRGHRLGLEKILILDPMYLLMDERASKKSPVRFEATEKQQDSFDEYIKYSAWELHLETEVMDSKTLTDEDKAEYFEEIHVMRDWRADMLSHESIRMVPANYNDMLKLTKKHETPYILHLGALSVKTDTDWMNYVQMGYMVIFPAYWPILAYEIGRPYEVSMVFALVYDVEKNERIMTHINTQDMPAKNGVLLSNVYYDLYQIKHTHTRATKTKDVEEAMNKNKDKKEKEKKNKPNKEKSPKSPKS